MTVPYAFEEVREDLEALLGDVFRSVIEEEAEILPDGVEPPMSSDAATAATSVLAIADDSDDTRLGIRITIPGRLAHTVAARMFGSEEPGSEDLLDAVGELGNIAGGNVKALLFGSTGRARLSLPSATLGAGPTPRDGARLSTVRALVLGDVAELTLIPHMEGADLIWPPTLRSEVLEGQL